MRVPFAPPETTPPDAPFFATPVEPPLDFVPTPGGPPDDGPGREPPVDVSGLPPLDAPPETPAMPPLFETPPVDTPEPMDLG